MVFPVFAALYYWMPVATGRMLSERLGRWAFWLMFVGFNAAFLPMHLTGLRGMPRRVYGYSEALGVDGLNLSTTVFSFVMGAGVLVVVFDVVRQHRAGRHAIDNPWDAPSLEWMAGSKPYAFRSLVPITSRYPLWEQKDLRDDEASGRGYLPDAPTGQREALVTSAIATEPQQIIRLPGPGWTGFVAAATTAIGLAASTIQLTALGVVAGLVAAATYLHWLWSMDRALPRQPADAGRGLALPLHSNDGDSVGSWGMVVLLISDVVVIASFAFAYLFLWTARPVAWPPDGSRLPGVLEPAVIAMAVAGAWLFFEAARRFNRRDRRPASSVCLGAAAILASGALAMGWMWLTSLGIDSTRHAYGAAVWTLLGYMALHVAVGAGMALWCLARLALGMLDSWRSLTLHICVLWWRLTAAAGVLALVLVAGFPRVVS
jgi:cytochrome c oxidase subunit I+III